MKYLVSLLIGLFLCIPLYSQVGLMVEGSSAAFLSPGYLYQRGHQGIFEFGGTVEQRLEGKARFGFGQNTYSKSQALIGADLLVVALEQSVWSPMNIGVDMGFDLLNSEVPPKPFESWNREIRQFYGGFSLSHRLLFRTYNFLNIGLRYRYSFTTKYNSIRYLDTIYVDTLNNTQVDKSELYNLDGSVKDQPRLDTLLSESILRKKNPSNTKQSHGIGAFIHYRLRLNYYSGVLFRIEGFFLGEEKSFKSTVGYTYDF